MEAAMWKKLKAAITGSNREEFRSILTQLIRDCSRFDLSELALQHNISGQQLEREVDQSLRTALFGEWTSHADARDLNLDREADRLSNLGLGRNFSRRILEEFGQARIQRIVQEILADGEVEPDEDRFLADEVRALGLPTPNSKELDEARQLWKASNEPLPVFDPPLLLKRGEVCHQACEATAFEDRTKTVRINYGGPSARVRIMKGVYYTVGSAKIERQTEDYSHELGQGILCGTNGRLVFISPSKSITIALGKIIQYSLYSDGIKIFKDTGKPLTFVFPNSSKADVVRVARIIDECR